MQSKKILFLASDCESSRWVFNALNKQSHFIAAIIEAPVSRKLLFKKRIKRIGLLKVSGQALFSLFIVPLLKFKAKKRKTYLINKYKLDNSPFDEQITIKVKSVNDQETLQLLQKLKPDLVVVNGTRIISKKILEATHAQFINMHTGITPWYRGAHGGYWALYNNDENNFGTTIHLVDSGIDSGAVLKQVFVKPSNTDNFTTYPVLQVAEGIELFKKVLEEINNDQYTLTKQLVKGALYYQPTIWQYVSKRKIK